MNKIIEDSHNGWTRKWGAAQWFDRVGHHFLRFPVRPWYKRKQEPSFADMLTTLRRVSYEEKTEPLLAEPSGLKTWIAQITELLSRAE